jgi:hypothetical protein
MKRNWREEDLEFLYRRYRKEKGERSSKYA